MDGMSYDPTQVYLLIRIYNLIRDDVSFQIYVNQPYSAVDRGNPNFRVDGSVCCPPRPRQTENRPVVRMGGYEIGLRGAELVV